MPLERLILKTHHGETRAGLARLGGNLPAAAAAAKRSLRATHGGRLDELTDKPWLQGHSCKPRSALWPGFHCVVHKDE